MTNLGRCSKHRHIREFKVGDLVRVVCIAGRPTPNIFLGDMGTVVVVSPYYGEDVLYKVGLEEKWGGLIQIKPGYNYFSPRALEIINQ